MTISLEEHVARAREELAKGRMAVWPGYPLGSTWESIGPEQRAYWLEGVSDVDAQSAARAAIAAVCEREGAGEALLAYMLSAQERTWVLEGLQSTWDHGYDDNDREKMNGVKALIERLKNVSPAPGPAEAMRAALVPFATFGIGVDGEEIRDSLMRDRICDWFGPSDFDAARAARKGNGEGR